jgi:Ca-activated chloride channel homolog
MNLVDFSRFEKENQDLVKEVTALGLKYSLMTPYTSFVAVDQVKRADGQLVTVKQPLPMPEGVSDLAVGRGGAGNLAFMPSMMPASPSRLLAKEGSMGFGGGGRKPKAGPHSGGAVPAEPQGSKVSVAVKDVQVKGGLTPAAVRQALESEVAKLTQCCQDAAKAGVKLPAELTVTFSIGLDGKITGTPKVAPKATLKSLKDCLAAALKGILFPQPQKTAAAVTVTLSLSEK